MVSQGGQRVQSALAKPHSVRREPLVAELVRQVLLFHQERVIIQVQNIPRSGYSLLGTPALLYKRSTGTAPLASACNFGNWVGLTYPSIRIHHAHTLLHILPKMGPWC